MDSNEAGEPSGFQQSNKGLLDHLTEADDRVELDLFDDGERTEIPIGCSSSRTVCDLIQQMLTGRF